MKAVETRGEAVWTTSDHVVVTVFTDWSHQEMLRGRARNLYLRSKQLVVLSELS
jgi:hypothetical protein